MKINHIIQKSNLDEICDATTGDCESVAVALSRVFDINSFVNIYEPSERKRATHSTVKINGNLYDGSGKTSKNELVDYLGLWKTKDIDEVNSKDEMINYIKENCIVEISPDKANLRYDEELVEKLVRRLESNK